MFFSCTTTCDGSADLGGGGLAHLQRRLLAVPGGVRRADQIGGVLQGTLRKAKKGDIGCGKKKIKLKKM